MSINNNNNIRYKLKKLNEDKDKIKKFIYFFKFIDRDEGIFNKLKFINYHYIHIFQNINSDNINDENINIIANDILNNDEKNYDDIYYIINNDKINDIKKINKINKNDTKLYILINLIFIHNLLKNIVCKYQINYYNNNKHLIYYNKMTKKSEYKDFPPLNIVEEYYHNNNLLELSDLFNCGIAFNRFTDITVFENIKNFKYTSIINNKIKKLYENFNINEIKIKFDNFYNIITDLNDKIITDSNNKN